MPAVSQLIENLGSRDPSLRFQAAYALALMGPEASEAVAALAQLLRDREALVREAAAFALGLIGPEARAAVPNLIASLNDHSPSVRACSATALGRIGPAAVAAIPPLTAAAAGSVPFDRLFALAALETLEGGNRLNRQASEISDLIERLSSQKADQRSRAAYLLAQRGSEAREAVPELIRLLRDDQDAVRKAAAFALGEIGTHAFCAIPELVSCLLNNGGPCALSDGIPGITQNVFVNALLKIDPGRLAIAAAITEEGNKIAERAQAVAMCTSVLI
jgi:HEAT repeat protein